VLQLGLAESLNYGLYLPEFNGRFGKFLDEERLLKEYSLPGPIAQLEVRLTILLLKPG
jgi:SH3 and multiple ankyrin repeat domains protein